MKRRKRKKPVVKTSNALCRTGTEAQTVLFDAEKWTVAKARKWLKEHNMKSPRVSREGNYLRFRQAPPNRFTVGSFRTKTIDRKMGVKLVIGCPKSGKKPARRKINPSPSIPKILVFLGRAVELSFADDTVFKWRGSYAVLANPEGTRLYILKTSKKKDVDVSDTASVDKARGLYSRFTEFESEKSELVSTTSARLTKIGLADHIVYESNKWSGKKIEYIHEFTRRPAVWADHQTKPTALVLVGIGIKVKKEGITG